jgi:EAL domain-containing protein (putative c-di-GMP-specific phosphodiesterase class I)
MPQRSFSDLHTPVSSSKFASRYSWSSHGRGRSFVFVPALREEAIERREMETELHRAVEAKEFELFYQPQVRISDGAIVGAEALIRWNHPERGRMSPGAFLPALESGSLAGIVGDWVLETACSQIAAWRKQESRPLRVGVNLFSAQFRDNNFDERIAELIERHGLSPEALELEITENIVLNQDELILKPLQKLRAIGVGIAFDDFGTGYASLSLLKDYPLTRLKIDQSFIRNMCASSRDEATVAASIGLGRNYDLEVIAEGVETRAQFDKLVGLNCDEVQGYLFGKPMPATEFAEVLRGSFVQP